MSNSFTIKHLNTGDVYIQKGTSAIHLTHSNKVDPQVFIAAYESVKFAQWVDALDVNAMKIEGIEIRDVFMFNKTVGFITLLMTATSRMYGNRVPGYVVLRGKAVAVLVVVNENKLLLVEQMRAPVGRYVLETPAGMMDDDQNLYGKVIDEMKEETGLRLDADSLIDLGSFYPSQGVLDEQIHCYAVHVNLDEEELHQRMEQVHGEEGSTERIRLRLIPATIEAVLATQDSKLAFALLSHAEVIVDTTSTTRPNIVRRDYHTCPVHVSEPALI